MSGITNVRELALAARAAGACIASLTTARKCAALAAMADALDANARVILAANQIDVDAARAAGRAEHLVDRLQIGRAHV